MNKNIHQIWLQGADKVPLKYHSYTEKTKELNPNWTYKLWDDEDIRQECLKYGKECFNKYMTLPHLHQKVDLGRYVILYNNGGISVDMDAKAMKSFDKIPGLDSNKMIVCKLDLNNIESLMYCQRMSAVNNAHIYSPKHNKSMKNVIDGIIYQEPITSLSKQIDILRTTGPLHFSKLVDDDTIKLDYQYFEPKTLGDIEQYPETIILHDTDGSWLNENFKCVYNSYKWLKTNFLFIIMVVVVLLLSMRYVNINTN